MAGLVIAVTEQRVDAEHALRGTIGPVAVRRPWRRRGLARALMCRSLRALRDRGATSAALDVDGENPSRALVLYESIGFAVTGSSTVYRKPLSSPPAGT